MKGDLGCRYRDIPHDFVVLFENPQKKIERCKLCNKTKRYNKGYKQRSDNIRYLKDHLRNFAQPWGTTRRVYLKIYHPEQLTIKL